VASVNLTSGSYFPGNSFLHNLDPGAKIASVGMLIFTASLLQNLPGIIFLCICNVILFSLTCIPRKLILVSVKPFLWLFILTVILHLFAIGEAQDAMFRLGTFYVKRKGLFEALTIGGKFLVIILFSLLLISTTSPQVLVKILIKWFSPLEKIKIPVGEIGLMIMIALRFLPILQEEAFRIIEARKIKSMVIGAGEADGKIASFQELLFAIFAGVLRRSQELSLSMAARGYGSVPLRDLGRKSSSRNAGDIAVVFLTLGLSAILILLDRNM